MRLSRKVQIGVYLHQIVIYRAFDGPLPASDNLPMQDNLSLDLPEMPDPRAHTGPSTDDANQASAASHAPLAERLRPRTLDEVVGQDHLLALASRCAWPSSPASHIP